MFLVREADSEWGRAEGLGLLGGFDSVGLRDLGDAVQSEVPQGTHPGSLILLQ
jgi:hypothetical protein